MDALERLAQVLPKLKTKLQLTGLIALVGGVIATRAVRPSAVLAQISAGAIGVLFLIFGQVFSSLGQVRPDQRAQLIYRLFIIFVVFILALVLLTGVFLVHGGNSPSQPSQIITPAQRTRQELGVTLVFAMSQDGTIKQISDRLTREAAARDKIKTPLRNFYSGLLNLKENRREFRSFLEARIALIEGKAEEKQLNDNLGLLRLADDVVLSGLRSVKLAFQDIQVDLDMEDPNLSAAFPSYVLSNIGIFKSSTNWDDKSSDELRDLLRQLDANTLLLDSLLDDLRALVRKFFPDLGDLYEPASPRP